MSLRAPSPSASCVPRASGSQVVRVDVLSVSLLFGDAPGDGRAPDPAAERARYTAECFGVWFSLDSRQSAFVELVCDGPVRQAEFVVREGDHAAGLQVELYHRLPQCSPGRRFLLGEASVPLHVLLDAEASSEVVLEVRPLAAVPVDPQAATVLAEHGAHEAFGASLRLRLERYSRKTRRPPSARSTPTVVAGSVSPDDRSAVGRSCDRLLPPGRPDSPASVRYASSSVEFMDAVSAGSRDSLRSSTTQQSDFVRKLNLADSPVTVVQSLLRAASAGSLDEDRPRSPVSDSAVQAVAPRALTGLISLEIVAGPNMPRERRLLRVHPSNNPFVVVSFDKQSFRTAVVRRTLDPVWRERCFFSLRPGQAGYHISFSTYDYKRMSYNACLGTATLRAQTLLETPNEIQKIALSMRPPGEPDTAESAGVLLVKAVFITYDVMRRNFWQALAARFDHDDDGCLNRFEVSVMLQSIGSTIPEETVDALLARVTGLAGPFKPVHEFPIEDVVSAMEELTLRSGRSVPSETAASSATSMVMRLRAMFSTLEPTETQADAPPRQPDENIVHIAKCPICLRVFEDAADTQHAEGADDLEVVTHLAVCAAKDQGLVDRFVMGGFLTEDYASRNWLVRLVSFLSFGGYRIGKNNGNIFVQDRRTGRLFEERMPTYVRLGIRWMHQHMAAGVAVDNALVRHVFQSLTIKQGRRVDEPASKRLIPGFVRFHEIDMDEFAEPIEAFRTFNEFFYRKLRPGARVLEDESPAVIVSPADCRINVFASVSEATRLWIKGSAFSLARLLKDNALGDYFSGGSLAVCRLAPQDYHRFHAPVDGRILLSYTVPGAYFTVNPMAVRHGTIDVFGENKRTVVLIEAPAFGPRAKVAYVAVGAMMVGSVVITAVADGAPVSRLDEIGYFAFGGSTIVVLFPPPPPGMRLVFDQDLVANSLMQLETLVQVGNSIARLVPG